MVKAVWKGATLAESEDTRVVEGNHYFPPDSIHWEYFAESAHHTVCGWKGRASYYTVQVGDATNKDAAWYYPDPKPAAQDIRGYVAFWHGVKVVPSGHAEMSTSENDTSMGARWKRLLRPGV